MSRGETLFFYGTLRHLPLLEIVLGRVPDLRPARLPGHAPLRLPGVDYPTLYPAEGAVTDGVLLEGLTDEDRARIDYYEGEDHYAPKRVTVETDDGPAGAVVYAPGARQAPAAEPWDFEAWRAVHGAVAERAARSVMGAYGRLGVAEMDRAYPTMVIRAWSAERAAREPAPTTLRSGFRGEDLEILDAREPYTDYFAVGEQDLRFPKFNGGMSVPVRRAVFLMGDAVTVLPYDPARDRVLMIEQFRFGPHMRGDPRPWSLEPVAGRIDPGETPEAAARRETEEEARVTLGALHEVGRYYPSPGAVSEWLVSYVGIADLPDGAAVVAGVDAEDEDIKGHLVSFDDLMGLVASGEAATGPLILSAQWLALNRERLRAGG